MLGSKAADSSIHCGSDTGPPWPRAAVLLDGFSAAGAKAKLPTPAQAFLDGSYY